MILGLVGECSVASSYKININKNSTKKNQLWFQQCLVICIYMYVSIYLDHAPTAVVGFYAVFVFWPFIFFFFKSRMSSIWFSSMSFDSLRINIRIYLFMCVFLFRTLFWMVAFCWSRKEGALLSVFHKFKLLIFMFFYAACVYCYVDDYWILYSYKKHIYEWIQFSEDEDGDDGTHNHHQLPNKQNIQPANHHYYHEFV